MKTVLYNVALTSLSLTVEGVSSGFTLHQAKSVLTLDNIIMIPSCISPLLVLL